MNYNLMDPNNANQLRQYGLQNDIDMSINLSNDNLINIANTIDPTSLNGTNLDDIDIPLQKVYKQQIKNGDNTSLIKSLTKEIINNLKDNNLTLYDNSSINSRKNLNNYDVEDETICSTKSSKKKNKKKDKIEDFITNNEITSSIDNQSNYINWFFDECFNYKDFLVLFIIYIILSQEMIKDFFSKYFSSLNPDNEGKIGIQGVIIYGLILSVIYMITRKLI